MKNVMYLVCWSDPWIKVAKRLLDEYGYKPVWWVGCAFSTDDMKSEVLQNFSDMVYQYYVDAWKGRFPKEVEKKAQEKYLDVDFVKKTAQYELQAIKMLDRMDQDLRSFNFMERQRHFRNMLKQWMAVIDIYKPDLVINSDIPHRFFDYLLFLLCKEKGIPYITFQHTQFPGRFFPLKNNFFSLMDLFVEDWKYYEKFENVKNSIPSDILSAYEKINKEYDEAIPDYMVKQFDLQKESDGFGFMIKRWFRKFATVYRPYLLGKPAGGQIIGHCAYDKRADKKYEESDGNIYQHERMLVKVNKYKKELKQIYESLTSNPDYGEKYVVHFLHYQPEATTCPGGDIFVDQRLCIELLLKYLPSDYKIYVKEHPSQFMRYMIGHTGRMRDLYDDLIKNERVKLISTTIDSFELIKYAQAVGTVTGTVGWEAMVRKKPVIAFGLSWYENYTKGVLRVTDEDSAKNMTQFIENYHYDEHSLLAYLAAVEQNTKLAYYWPGQKAKLSNLSEEECVNNIVESIVEQL